MGASISTYVNGITGSSISQPSFDGRTGGNVWIRNRRLRNRIRRGRRAGHARSSGLFSVDAESGLPEKENTFRYPPVDVSSPYLSTSFLLGGEKHERPTLASPLADTAYAFGENYDVNFLVGKCNTVNLPTAVHELSAPATPLRAVINIRRDSVRLLKCKTIASEPASCFNIEFTFDALVRCGITIHYFCQEANSDVGGMRFIPHPKAMKFASRQYVYTAGSSQRFIHSDHVIDVKEMKMFSTFSDKPQLTSDQQQQMSRLSTNSGGTKRSISREGGSIADTSEQNRAVPMEVVAVAGGSENIVDTTHYIPIVIHCVSLEDDFGANSGPRQSHATFLFVERTIGANNDLVLKYIKQKVWIGGASFLLQEVFGIENKHAGLPTAAADAIENVHDITRHHDDDGSDGPDDDNDESDDEDESDEESGNDCVICMSEPRDTLILPCRHLCICSQCAESLRYQANNCPICRAPFKYLLQLRSYLRMSAEEQQRAQAAMCGIEQQQQAVGLKIPTGLTPPDTNATGVVTNERQMSIVPGDSDADDDCATVDLGKKKSRDRVESPVFAGFATCALIDTLNGTKQDYDVLRTATSAHQQQQQKQQPVTLPVLERNIPGSTGRVISLNDVSRNSSRTTMALNGDDSLGRFAVVDDDDDDDSDAVRDADSTSDVENDDISGPGASDTMQVADADDIPDSNIGVRNDENLSPLNAGNNATQTRNSRGVESNWGRTGKHEVVSLYNSPQMYENTRRCASSLASATVAGRKTDAELVGHARGSEQTVPPRAETDRQPAGMELVKGGEYYDYSSGDENFAHRQLTNSARSVAHRNTKDVVPDAISATESGNSNVVLLNSCEKVVQD